ncbi:MAG TPA: hypothetical protein VLH19_01535 [Patescibacteria group bacterium]|nr:hypothetical protein [Patescibacteria group bacterium]
MRQPKYFISSQEPEKKAKEVTVQPEISVPKVHIRLPKQVAPALGILSFVALVSLSLLSLHIRVPQFFPVQPSSGSVVAQTGGGSIQGTHYDILTADSRVDIIAGFLSRYKSPLQPYQHYGQALVDAADRYGLDWRLLPAIMMQESNLCKASDPKLHNCLGFGIHKAGTLGFDTYEDSFDRAARELKERYIDIGLTTPELIQTKYTPSSPHNAWSNSVDQWIAEMEFNSRDKGKTSTASADLTQYTRNSNTL